MDVLDKPTIIREGSSLYRSRLNIGCQRTCSCNSSHINCMTPKQWLKSQIGVWQFNYEARDIRKKDIHPATFPISLSRKVIELFSCEVVVKSKTHTVRCVFCSVD